MPVLHPLWRDAETVAVQVVAAQWMPEEEQDGTEEHFRGAVLIRVCPGIALLIAQVGKVTAVVCQQKDIPQLADSVVAFVVVRLFADLVIEAVVLAAAEIFAHVAAIAVVVAAFVVVFDVAFVLTAVGSGLNVVLAAVAVPVSVVIARVVATVVDGAIFVVGVLAVAFAEFAVYGASVSGFAAAEVAAEFDFGNLFGCCLQNSHFARVCYHEIPDNSLLPSFAWAAQKLTEKAEVLMCSQWRTSHSVGD